MKFRMIVLTRLSLAAMLLAPMASADLLVHLQMNEGSGAATANSGTLGGTADVQSGLEWVAGGGPGGNGNAISYGTANGTGYNTGISYMTEGLDSLTQYTITTWFKLNAPVSSDRPAGLFTTRNDNGESGSQQWWITASDSRYWMNEGPSTDRLGAGGGFANTVDLWQFVAVTMNGTTARVYVGTETTAAVLVDTINNVSGNTGTAGDRLKVGGSQSGWAIYNMPAQFADVRYYNEQLDATAIEAIRISAVSTLLDTTTQLVSSVNPSVAGGNVTFTATVRNEGAPATDATGTITFEVDGSPASVEAVVNGVATYSTSALAVGNRTINAIYSGDTVYNGSNVSIVQTITDSPYDIWADGYELVGGPHDDDDGDGMTNFQEFAFGLVPTSGASANPITDVSDSSRSASSATLATPTAA
jgi:hypothetical protein